MSREVTKQHQTIEEIKQVNEHDSDVWPCACRALEAS